MQDVAPSDERHFNTIVKGWCETESMHMNVMLTMQMRHLYRSPLSICLSSSLIRAFRASMVVAVDSSSVTLGGRNRGKDKEMFSCDTLRHIYRYETVCKIPPQQWLTKLSQLIMCSKHFQASLFRCFLKSSLFTLTHKKHRKLATFLLLLMELMEFFSHSTLLLIFQFPCFLFISSLMFFHPSPCPCLPLNPFPCLVSSLHPSFIPSTALSFSLPLSSLWLMCSMITENVHLTLSDSIWSSHN